jgi:hypothetical protein
LVIFFGINPYLHRDFCRDKFRARKKELKAKAEKDSVLLSKTSLDLTLVDECPEDVRFAQLLSIQVSGSLVI